MAIGVQEIDVWHAADAILAAGEQPTIERVRLKIGRGSPNTVGPHLKSWFRRLSERMSAMPNALLRPPADADESSQRAGEVTAALAAMPAAFAHTALQFWETALTLAREEWQGEAAEAREAITKGRAALDQAREALAQDQARLVKREQDLVESLQAARDRALAAETALQAAESKMEAGARATATQQSEIARLQALLLDTQSRHESTVASLESRHQAHERRWLAEIDELRQAQKKLLDAAEVSRKNADSAKANYLSTIADLKADAQDQSARATRAEMDVAGLASRLEQAERSALANQESWEARVSAMQDQAAAQITQLQQQLETKDRQIELLARAGRVKPAPLDSRSSRKSPRK